MSIDSIDRLANRLDDPVFHYIDPDRVMDVMDCLYKRFVYQYGHVNLETGDRVLRRALYGKQSDCDVFNLAVGNKFKIGDLVLWPHIGNRTPKYGTIVDRRARLTPGKPLNGVFLWLVGFSGVRGYKSKDCILKRFDREGLDIAYAIKDLDQLYGFGLDAAFIYVPAGHYWLDTPVIFPNRSDR